MFYAYLASALFRAGADPEIHRFVNWDTVNFNAFPTHLVNFTRTAILNSEFFNTITK